MVRIARSRNLETERILASPPSIPTAGMPFSWATTNACADWVQSADELADWVFKRLVNRTDVFGRYIPPECRSPGRSPSYTCPARPEDRVDGVLNADVVRQHFCEGNPIGLHAISRENLSRWLLCDIDQHGEVDADAAATNLCAARAWLEKLQAAGFRPLLLDSNGKGGLHLLVLFSQPAPSASVFQFGQWLVADFAAVVPGTLVRSLSSTANRPGRFAPAEAGSTATTAGGRKGSEIVR